jgi:hypothetical protein
MAQADAVRSVIRASITGATATASTKARPAHRRYLTPRSCMVKDEPVFPWLWRDMRAEGEREGLPPVVAIKDLNRLRIPIGWHVVTVCYATAVILLGWWPWNLFLLLLLFPIRNERVRFYAFPTVAAKESMRRRESKGRGSST